MFSEILIIVLWFSFIGFFIYQSRQWIMSLKQLLQNQNEQLEMVIKASKVDQKTEGFKMMLPLRIQASERLVLFLERLQPQLIVSRHMNESAYALELAQHMLRGIREEFDYNLSQQLFISDTAWQLTKAAKEEVIQVIHINLNKLDKEADKTQLASLMLESDIQLIERAIQLLRDDLNQMTR